MKHQAFLGLHMVKKVSFLLGFFIFDKGEFQYLIIVPRSYKANEANALPSCFQGLKCCVFSN